MARRWRWRWSAVAAAVEWMEWDRLLVEMREAALARGDGRERDGRPRVVCGLASQMERGGGAV